MGESWSDVGLDLTGPEVHADGAIWNGTNFDVRQAFNRRYDELFPSGNKHLQQTCADGQLPANQCPGSRRWLQLVYDGFLLSQSTMTWSAPATPCSRPTRKVFQK